MSGTTATFNGFCNFELYQLTESGGWTYLDRFSTTSGAPYTCTVPVVTGRTYRITWGGYSFTVTP